MIGQRLKDERQKVFRVKKLEAEVQEQRYTQLAVRDSMRSLDRVQKTTICVKQLFEDFEITEFNYS